MYRHCTNLQVFDKRKAVIIPCFREKSVEVFRVYFVRFSLSESRGNMKTKIKSVSSTRGNNWAIMVAGRIICDFVHVPNFEGVAGSEDFACATLPTTSS